MSSATTVQQEQCWGHTQDDDACRNTVKPPERFCGRCIGSSRVVKSYSMSLHRMDDEELASFVHTNINNITLQFPKRSLPLLAQQIIVKHGGSNICKSLITWHGDKLEQEILTKLAHNANPSVRAALADYYKLPAKIQMLLVNDKSDEVRKALGDNYARETAIRLKLLADKNPDVVSQAVVYCRDDLDVEAWEQVAARDNPAIHSAIIRCRYAPLHIREHLIKSADDETLLDLAVRRYAEQWVIEAVAKRLSKLKPSAVGEQVLMRLFKSYRWYLSGKRLNKLMKTFEDTDVSDIWLHASAHPQARRAALSIIVRKDHTENVKKILKNVLRNRRCSAEHLEEIVRRCPKQYDILVKIAEHEHASPETLETLAMSKSSRVRSAVAGNCNTPAHILQQFGQNADLSISERVAQNPNTSADIMSQLAEHKDQFIRSLAAKHPNTPEQHLTLLALESNHEISEAAAKNLQQRSKSKGGGHDAD